MEHILSGVSVMLLLVKSSVISESLCRVTKFFLLLALMHLMYEAFEIFPYEVVRLATRGDNNN